MLERVSKAVVVLSACAAVLAGAWLGAREWEPLWPMTLVALTGAFAAARRWGARAWTPMLIVAYLIPVIFLGLHDSMKPAYWMPWVAALLGGVMGTIEYRQWRFPGRWKWPLAYWALAVALVWPVVVAREADFSWDLMSRYNLGNSGLGGPPPVIAVWVVSVALTHLLGVLWLDAFVTAFPCADRENSARRFARVVVWPLGVSVGIGSMLAIYQGTVDVAWLSDHQWPDFNRAAGGLLDGDAFGALAGVWVGIFLAAAVVSRSMLARAAAVAGACAACAGLWMTGSRMALLAGLICLVAGGLNAIVARKWSFRQMAIGSIGVAALVVVLGSFVEQSSTTSPVTRLMESVPPMTSDGLRKFAVNELWNRWGPFGSAFVQIVRHFPLSGIGVGNFNHMFPDYAFILTGDRGHMDNAQSWYRHQLAELGFIGSLGWLLWLPRFSLLTVRTRGTGVERFPAAMIKSALLAVGLMSLVSMPTQSLPVALTVWVLVYWYVLLAAPAAERLAAPGGGASATVWPVWILAVAFAVLTAVVGWRELRPPYRAIGADWTYQVGFFDLETREVGPGFRWTERRATMVFPATGAWLKLTVSGGPADIAERPIRLDVRRRGKSIVSVTRTSAAPDTWYVRAPAGEKRMMLEFAVSRTWRPADAGVAGDDRERGIAVDDWMFVDRPPFGAVLIR